MIASGRLACAALVPLALAGCGGGGHRHDARFPERPRGCAVQVYEEPPPAATVNIGSMRAWCDAGVSRDECLRALEDQACRLGADVVWGVSEPTRSGTDRSEWSGRAAHTR